MSGRKMTYRQWLAAFCKRLQSEPAPVPGVLGPCLVPGPPAGRTRMMSRRYGNGYPTAPFGPLAKGTLAMFCLPWLADTLAQSWRTPQGRVCFHHLCRNHACVNPDHIVRIPWPLHRMVHGLEAGFVKGTKALHVTAFIFGAEAARQMANSYQNALNAANPGRVRARNARRKRKRAERIRHDREAKKR